MHGPRTARRPRRGTAGTERRHGRTVTQARVVIAVAIGGGIGTAARYGASRLWPTPPEAFPWTTFAVNAVGCAAIGVLLVLIVETGTAHPLVRPFLGTGVLGGFTTFSTHAVDVQRLTEAGRTGTALGYLAATVLTALTAVWLAAVATRRAVAVRRATGAVRTADGGRP
ncbi:fluoride efflux transporter CrcB [Streptomyces pactum]|uniref:fluoride efflux transporter CrcB n=1 Tax=Streptomyces pactum TaxID=68249 RepID=UPI00355824C5